MSTFGKKYLNYWPYRFNSKQNTIYLNCLRWNKTNKDFQLELLKKWYPISMRGKSILMGKTTGGNLIEITGYSQLFSVGAHIENNYAWVLDVDYVDSGYRKDVHPINFIPEESDRLRILRELRLDNLLD